MESVVIIQSPSNEPPCPHAHPERAYAQLSPQPSPVHTSLVLARCGQRCGSALPAPSPAAHARARDHSKRADYAGRVSRPDPFRFPACEAEPGSRDRSVAGAPTRSEEHTSELQSRENLVCRLLLEKKKKKKN